MGLREAKPCLLLKSIIMSIVSGGWYVIYVKPNNEKKIYESLKEISLEGFLPVVKVIKQWSDRKKTIFKPLFPSYVFVKINSSMDFYKALSINGVYSYIQFGKEYARVTEQEINQIKLLVGDTTITDIETNATLPKAGELKTITHGPLAGLDCEIIKADNHNKIIVRIDSLRQNIIATIPSYNLSIV